MAVNAFYAFFSNFKRNLTIRVIQIVVAVSILMSSSRVMLIPCLFLAVASIFYHYLQVAVASIKPSKFLRNQQELIRRVMQSSRLQNGYTIRSDLRSPTIQKFNKDQVQVFINSVGTGLFAWKMLDVYVYSLNRYRRGVAPLLFGLSSFIWIFAQSIIALTLINLALLKISPRQFDRSDSSLIAIAYYSISSLYSNTVPVLAPVGDWAVGINFAAAFYGPVLVLTLLTQLALGWRQSRDSMTFDEVVREVRLNRRQLEGRLGEEYEVRPAEALNRLIGLGVGMGPFLNYLFQRIPEAFEPGNR